MSNMIPTIKIAGREYLLSMLTPAQIVRLFEQDSVGDNKVIVSAHYYVTLGGTFSACKEYSKNGCLGRMCRTVYLDGSCDWDHWYLGAISEDNYARLKEVEDLIKW